MPAENPKERRFGRLCVERPQAQRCRARQAWCAAKTDSQRRIGGIALTPYAAGQFTTFDLPAHAEQVLSGANTFALAYSYAGKGVVRYAW
jgi:hypothetical protein